MAWPGRDRGRLESIPSGLSLRRALACSGPWRPIQMDHHLRVVVAGGVARMRHLGTPNRANRAEKDRLDCMVRTRRRRTDGVPRRTNPRPSVRDAHRPVGLVIPARLKRVRLGEVCGDSIEIAGEGPRRSRHCVREDAPTSNSPCATRLRMISGDGSRRQVSLDGQYRSEYGAALENHLLPSACISSSSSPSEHLGVKPRGGGFS